MPEQPVLLAFDIKRRKEVGVINVMLEIQMDILILVLLVGVGIHSCFMLNKKKQIHRLFSLIIFLRLVVK